MRAKKRFKIVVFISLALCATWMVTRYRSAQKFIPVAVSKDQLRVVTWNVGYFSLSSNKNLQDSDLEHITEVIRSSEAQVVILQEVSHRKQTAQLTKDLGENWSVYQVETGHQGQILSILTNLTYQETIVGEAGGRKILGVSLRHPSEREIFITGVHSPHPARGKKETLESIRVAYEFTRQRPESIRIFAGDLNYIFDQKSKDTLYGDLTSVMSDSTVSLGDTYYFGTRIDHVFHAPKTIQVEISSSGMIDYPPRVAMVPGFRDHRPVVVTFELASI